MNSAQYKKGWLVTTGIAKMLIGAEPGERINTIREYVSLLGASRGMVQNTLQVLQDEGAVALEKRGKFGTFITAIDQAALFRLADIQYITGSMPTPFTYVFAGLATGISRGMGYCPVPFNFAFVQGAGNRVDALRRGVCDFVILSEAAAARHTADDPALEIAAALNCCRYGEPYVFCSRGEEITAPMDGMTIAADPRSTDQFRITRQLCESRNVELVQCAFSACRAMFLERAVDCVVYPREDWTRMEGIWTHELPGLAQRELHTPSLLTLKSNAVMGRILRACLADEEIAGIQKQVMERKTQPRFS